MSRAWICSFTTFDLWSFTAGSFVGLGFEGQAILSYLMKLDRQLINIQPTTPRTGQGATLRRRPHHLRKGHGIRMAPRSSIVSARSFDIDDDLNSSSAALPSPTRRFSPPKVDRRNRLFQEVHFDISHFCFGIYRSIIRYTLEQRHRPLAEEEGVEMADFKR